MPSTIRVVVVLPFVPVIATEPNESRREILWRTPGANLRATTPGMVDPPPLPKARLASRAARAANTAAETRTLSKVVLTIGIIPARINTFAAKPSRSRFPKDGCSHQKYTIPSYAYYFYIKIC
jgi:hypothetical protein